MEEVTYQDYLNATGGEKEEESKEVTYRDYLENQKIREWLKSHNRENAAITPSIEKRYNRYVSTPGIKPEDVDVGLTTGEKFAKSLPVQALATAGKNIWESMAQPYEMASYLGRNIGGAINPYIQTQNIAVDGQRPQNILDLAAQVMRQKGEQIGEASAPTGSATDIGVGGLTNAATLAIKMGAMGGAGVPKPAIFPLESSLSKMTESERIGGAPLKQTLEGVKGFAEGYVLDKVLHYIPQKTKNVIKQYGLNTAALTVIPEVKNAIEKVERGEDPLDIDWESMVKGLGVTALLPLIFGVNAEGVPSKRQRGAIAAKDREAQWRIEQDRIQEADVRAKFDKLPQEMTAREKVLELAELQKRAEVEFGEKGASKPVKLEQPEPPRVIGQGNAGVAPEPTVKQAKAAEIKASSGGAESKSDIEKFKSDYGVDKYNKLKADIDKNGLKEPIQILVDPTGREIIYDGEHRYIAMQELGRQIPADKIQKINVDNIEKYLPDRNSWMEFKGPERESTAKGKGLSIEELNRPFEVRTDKNGTPLEMATPEGEGGIAKIDYSKGERAFVLDPQTNKWYDKTVGGRTEVTDPAQIDALNASKPGRGYVEQPELEISPGAGLSAEERAALGIKDVPAATGELKTKPRGSLLKTGAPEAKQELPPAKAEPQTVTNIHAAKVVNKAAEIRNTTDELTEMMGEAATHQKMNLAEQGRMASELSPELARDVALGKRRAPEMRGSDGHFLKEEAVWVAEKNRAIANGNVDYLMELAKNSAVQEQISQSGKSLVLLRNRNPHDPVYQIMQINKEAKNTIEKNLGNKKIQEVTTKRLAELERIIAEQTKKIEDYENRKTIREFKFEARKKGRIRAKEELRTEFDYLVNEFERQTANQANIGLDPKIIKLMGRMAANRVEAGVLTIEQVVEDIYKAVGEKIDRRTIRDAVTGYGKIAEPSRDEIDKQLRELKRQGRLISQLEDAESGLAPLRSGVQRDRPSERVKELRRQVEDAMRRHGLTIEKELKEKKKRIPPTEEERQITAIEKYKNYVKKRTLELEQRLIDGDYSIKPRKTTPIDPELQRRRDHVERLSKTYRSLKEINELRNNGVTKDEAREIIKRSNFVSEKKAAITDGGADRSVTGAPMEYGRALYDYFEYTNGLKQRARKITGKEWARKLASREFFKSVGHGLTVGSGVLKSIQSSMDISAIGRQGIRDFWRILKGETNWVSNTKKSFVDLFGKNDGRVAMREIMADVLSRPNAINGNYGKMKLDIGNIEEAYPEQLPEKIPVFGKVYKRSEAAFIGFQYRTRADLADIHLKIAENMGVDITDRTQLEYIGRYINSFTGRGYLGKAERSAETFNKLFFAPKFVKSNWDFITLHQLTDTSPYVRKQAAMDALRFAAGTASIMLLAKAMGAKIETDPRSSDFGKIRIGNTRFDLTGGAASLATTATRLSLAIISSGYQLFGGEPLNATKSSLTGKLSPLTTGKGFSRNGMDVVVDFAAGKLAPLAGIIARQGLTGMDFERKPLTWKGLFLKSMLPINFQNAIENLSMKDKKLAVMAWLADFVGIGTSTYGKEKKKTKWKELQ